jgi:hypothetical protein
MKTRTYSVVEQMLQAAICATRCRQAAAESRDPCESDALANAANRYSRRLAELADALASGARL